MPGYEMLLSVRRAAQNGDLSIAIHYAEYHEYHQVPVLFITIILVTILNKYYFHIFLQHYPKTSVKLNAKIHILYVYIMISFALLSIPSLFFF